MGVLLRGPIAVFGVQALGPISQKVSFDSYGEYP